MNHRKFYRFAGALVCTLVLCLSAASQSQTPDDPNNKVFKINVHEVIVPVSVKEANGGLVPNLEQEDFTIFEDKRKQTIIQFSSDPEPLSVVVLVDTEMAGETLRTLSKYWGVLSKNFTAEDEVSAYRFDHFVTKLGDFSNSPLAIEKSFAPVTEIAANHPKEADIPDTPLGGKLPGWLSDALRTPAPNPTADPTDPSKVDRPPQPGLVTKLLHDAIFTAANDLRNRAPGHRKVVIVLTDGRVTGGNIHSVAETRNLLLKEGADQIQVYGIGVDVTQPVFKRPFSILDSYSAPSGGDVYFATSGADIVDTFGHIVDQARSEYVMSYVSNNTPPKRLETYRSIDVKTTDPRLKVTHRSGYFQLPQP